MPRVSPVLSENKEKETHSLVAHAPEHSRVSIFIYDNADNDNT